MMCNSCSTLLTNAAINQYDPTRTTTLRNRFVSAVSKRFTALSGACRTKIVKEDFFALKGRKIVANAIEPYPFAITDKKVKEFTKWLNAQMDSGILAIDNLGNTGTAGAGWMNTFLKDSYSRGVQRAQMEMRNIGVDIPKMTEQGGIHAVMSQPFHIDRLGYIYSRAYDELEGITKGMSTNISKVLAQGMADGDGPAVLARKLSKVLTGAGGDLSLTDFLGRFMSGKRRAIILARTEMIRAHHQAMMEEYTKWGQHGVHVQAEYRTAGDDRVCSECQGYEGAIYTLKEARGIIPIHPQCRCIMLPTMPETIKDVKKVKTKPFSNMPSDEKRTLDNMASTLQLGEQDSNDLLKFWQELSPKQDILFEGGSPTCTVGSNAIGQWLEHKGFKPTYISGDFQEGGHWWTSVSVPDPNKKGYVKRFIADFGDNISESALDSGHITPKFIETSSKLAEDYVAEDYLTSKQFVKEMKKQGWKNVR